MKSFFGMAAAALLVVSLLFVVAPDAAEAKGVSLGKMQTIKQNADAALIVVVKEKEKHEKNRHWKALHHHAEQNAMVAAWYMELVQSGQEVFEEDADACDFAAKDIEKGISFFLAGHMDMVEQLIVKIEIRIQGMPTARAAAAVVIKVDFRGQTLDGRTIVIISERKRGGGVIVINTGGNGGGNNGGVIVINTGGNGGGDNGNNQEERCVACVDVDRVKLSTKCVDGTKTEEFEITVKCKKNYADSNYDDNCTTKKRATSHLGACCISNASCDDHENCTVDICEQDGTCTHAQTVSPHCSEHLSGL